MRICAIESSEVERDLAEDLERDDDRRQVEAWVADARKDDRIRPPAKRDPSPDGKRGGDGHGRPGAQYSRT